MNDDRMQRLERSLRAAHAAGDREAATQLAAAIRELRAAAPADQSRAGISRPVATALAQGHGGAQPAASGISPAMAGALAQGHGGQPRRERTPRAPRSSPARQRGQQSAAGGETLPAALQGYGSGMFGIGTPATAVGEFISAALPGGEPAVSPGEAMDYARGRREGFAESNPRAFYSGMGSSLFGGVGVGRAALAAAPAGARNVFSLQAGKTLHNLRALSAAGATAGGVTGLNEEGLAAGGVSAVAGGVLGPALGAGAIRAGQTVKRVAHWMRDGEGARHSAAIRKLSTRVSATADELKAYWDEFTQLNGRGPRIVEIMNDNAAGEMGQISRVRAGAAEVLQNAAHEANLARPVEMGQITRRGGTGVVSSETAQRALLPSAEEVSGTLTGRAVSENVARARVGPTVEAAADLTQQRVRSSVQNQVGTPEIPGGRRGKSMDRLMDRIENHRVPLTSDMADLLKTPDVMNSLDAGLRRRILAAIDAGEDIGTIDLTVRQFDDIRLDMIERGKMGVGSDRLYKTLGNRIRDYVGGVVPEYGAGLREFARRSATAEGTARGQNVASRATRDFLDYLSAGTPARQAGARVGVRNWLERMLTGDPAKASKALERLSADAGLQRSVSAALSEGEGTRLMQLAERFGVQLNFSKHAGMGQRLVRSGDLSELRASLSNVPDPTAHLTAAGQGVRRELADVLGGSEDEARRMLERLATDTRYRRHVSRVISPDEAAGLSKLSERYGRRLEIVSGFRAGTGITTRNNAEEFIDAVEQAAQTPSGAAGVRTGARSQVSAEAGDSPVGAVRTAQSLAEDPDLHRKLIVALGMEEGSTLRRVGETQLRAARSMALASPSDNAARARATEAASDLQNSIGLIVMATGRYSGAMAANVVASRWRQFSLTKATAKKLSELITDPDPENSLRVIKHLRKHRVSAEKIREMYRVAAAAVGVLSGQVVGEAVQE